MKRNKRFYSLPGLLLLAVLPLVCRAQSGEVKVSHLSFAERLTEDDETAPDFGRFDAYEVLLQRGDRLLVQVRATEFTPAIVLIAPDDTSHLAQFAETGRQTVTYGVEIPESGTWLLVVRGDSTALGPYQLQAWWVEAHSLQLPAEADLCDQVNFVIAHANADFYFISRPPLQQTTPPEYLPTVVLSGAISAKISPTDGYVALFYRGNNKQQAREMYSNLAGKLKFCNGGTWTEHFRDWRVVDVLNGTRQMVYELREKERDDYRFVRVVSEDFSANPLARQRFTVSVAMGRHQPR